MRSISVLFAVIVAVMQPGCTTAPAVRVATDAVFPPFHYVDESGSLAGFDIELARQVVERSGMQVRFERAESYAALFDGLQQRAIRRDRGDDGNYA